MRVSHLFGTTLREAPGDADIASHQLLVRAGYVRQLMAEALSAHKSSKNLLLPGDQFFALEAKVEKILSNPVLTGMEVYIHPFGVTTLRKIVEKKLRIKTAAIEMKIYCTGRDLAFYERYHSTWKKRWKIVNLPAAPSAPCLPGS